MAEEACSLESAHMIFPFEHWIWLIPVFLIGACIGSFLNVVIYRLPLGLSVNQPRRSFCPGCKAEIPLSQNIPILSWLLLRGTCKQCGVKISSRYLWVELLTAVLFVAVWMTFSPIVSLALWALVALLIAISFIDGEHLIIPTSLTWIGAGLGLLTVTVLQFVPALSKFSEPALAPSLLQSVIGWVAGFLGIGIIVELGKLAFGKRSLKFDDFQEWTLREPIGDHDPMLFVIGEEEIAWWDIFNRKTDQLIVETSEILVDGQSVGGGTLIIRERDIVLPDGTKHHLAALVSLGGKANSAVIPREAMGMGDAHLMGMIGAFFGWAGVVFSLFGGCFIALVIALIGRVGFGRQLPFGPSLALGALIWAFGGWQLWSWYVDLIGPLPLP